MDDVLPPSLPLERGRSAIGVQNNVGLVLEQVSLDLKNDPSIRIENKEENERDLMDVPVGSLALAHAVCGEDDMPAQVLSMIRYRSVDMAKQLGAAPNEEKSFALADPLNVPLPPPGEVPEIEIYKPSVFFNVVEPPPPIYAPPPPAYYNNNYNNVIPAAPFFYPSPSSLSSLASSSLSFSSAESVVGDSKLECPLCGCVDGEVIEEEEKLSEHVEKPEPVPATPSSVLPLPGEVFVKKDPPPASKPASPLPPAPSTVLPVKTQVCVLECSHMICKECFTRQLTIGWTGARASFNYLNCGLCGQQLRSSNKAVCNMLAPHLTLKQKVHDLAFAKFNEEGASLVNELIEKGKLTKGYTDVQKREVAITTMAIYKCVDCSEIFCGGRVSCAEEMDHDAKNMRCQGCVWSRLARETDHRCMEHGFKFAIFKCDSCCAVATWDCGWNHFCERCHGQAHNSKNYPCPGPDKCPLGMPHPKNLPANFGQSNDKSFIIPFVIGCMACVGYTAENPGCSRPSPAEMQWEIKKDPIKEAEFEKKKLEAQEAAKIAAEVVARKRAEEQAKRLVEAEKRRKEQSIKQEEEKKKCAEEQAKRREENRKKLAELELKGQKAAVEEIEAAVGHCSESKCKCVSFQPQKWQVNKCHKCFHWAKSHSAG